MLPVIGSFTSAIPGEPVAIALINNSRGSIKSLPGAPVTLGVSARFVASTLSAQSMRPPSDTGRGDSVSTLFV